MTTTLNPADKSAGITLSSGNLVMSYTSGSGDQSARATTGLSSGKVYFEAKFAASAGGDQGAGLANIGANLATAMSGPTGAIICYPATGNVYKNGVSQGTINAVSVNAWMGFAIDFGAGKLWIRNATATPTTWNGGGADPATNTGGYLLSGLDATLYPIGGLPSTVGGPWTFNFGVSGFAAALPSGFVAYDSGAPTVTFLNNASWTNTAAATVHISTLITDCILLVTVYNEHTGTAAATVSSVTGAGATFALRKRSNGSATGGLDLWWGHATGDLSNVNLTVNFSGAYDDAVINVCAVTGCANQSAPFDTNAGLPAALSAPTVTWTPSFSGINTSQAHDTLLFIAGSVSPTGAWTPPTGFTNIAHPTYGGGSWACMAAVDAQQVSTLQSGITVTSGTALSNSFSGTATCGEAIFDALTADVSAGGGGSQARVMVLA
ncbi:MAG TPA: hypothetical protein VFL55_06645 [Acetobacteraceae bacterium]|nr:hypothetical protein [Acetobacteraceae bacterium]